jgi:hypothetical protein
MKRTALKSRRARRSGAALLVAAIGALGPSVSAPAEAQYRLRADAYVTASEPTAGFVMLSSEARHRELIDADAVVWLGTGDRRGDVMVASIHGREPHGFGEARLGRMLLTAGGLRPVHLDGADVIARAPWGTSVEAFGGMPVVPELGAREFDWTVGGRLAQRVSTYGTVGLSYLHMRDRGSVSFEEAGLDALVTPTKWLDAAFMGAFDLLGMTLADARVSLAVRFSKARIELYGVRRAPSHLLPATSLFAALGDIPSQRAGGTLFVRAAPRLDLLGEGAVESLAGELGAKGLLRTTLRLDDRGDGALGLELRTERVPSASWVGVRGTARVPITRWMLASTELELVVPENPGTRGKVWPWGLVAMRFTPIEKWELAGAVEAGASPTALYAVSGLFRVSYTFDTFGNRGTK